MEPEPAVTPATGPFLELATPVPPPTCEQLLESATPVTPATGTFLEPATPVTSATGLFLEPATPVPPPTSEPLLEPAMPVTPATGPFLEPATPEIPATLLPLETATPVPTPNTGPLLEPVTPVQPPTAPVLRLSSKSKSVSTESLLQREQTIRSQQQQKGHKYKSRTVFRRLNLQKDELAQLAKTVHHGSKQDFLSSLAQSVCYSKSDSLVHHSDDWDGSLSPQDILTLAKQAHDPVKKMSVYNTIITESAPQHFHLSASDVLDIQDTTSATEIVRALRRKLPGFLDSERKVNAMKAKFVREFEVVWKPERTHSGGQINSQRLRETLRYLYWWLPENEWWKIYGVVEISVERTLLP